MMTYWIPNEPCMLPGNASHQVGVGGFVMNDKNEVYISSKFLQTKLEFTFVFLFITCYKIVQV